MPDIGFFHPQVVHFVIGLLFVGVALRVISLLGKPAFVSPAATTLLLLGAAAAVVAVKSGEDAHGPAERIPGAREMVVHHEERGELARNIFLAVAAVELFLLVIRRKRYRTVALAASGVVGVAGLLVLSEAAGHGGDIVYSYAGGVGTRSGTPEDVERLLLAGLYYQARQDREADRPEKAARLIEEMARRFPGDAEVALLAAESLLRDRADGTGALAALAGIQIPGDQQRLRLRHGLLVVEAFGAVGSPDSALVVLRRLADEFPASQTVRRRLEAFPSR
jgi:uncharacterized membrane protein